MSKEHPGVWRNTGSLLGSAVQAVRRCGAKLFGLLIVSQLIIVAVAFPLFRWLFKEALRAGGMHGFDMQGIVWGSGIAVSLVLLIAIAFLAFCLIALQFTALVMLLHRPSISLRDFFAELGAALRKLTRPSSLPLIAYLLLLLPLSGFGFASALTQGIAIPPFITGELSKSPASAAALTVFSVVLVVLNVRLAVTVPVFALTDATGTAALRLSWRLTRRWRSWMPLVLAVIVVAVAAALIWAPIALLAIVPTAISDAVAPDASVVVAAYSLGAAQVVGLLLTGLGVALIAGILIAHLRRHADRLPEHAPLREDREVMPETAVERSKGPALAVTAITVVAAIGFGTAGISTMQKISEYPSTAILAHRGFSDGGVENTIGGLEAAARANADMVEMDVMQTKDGEFVVIHDPGLTRLAGRPDAVKDLTQAELAEITVRDEAGHEGRIPSLEEYVLRAKELEMPLLIEIKMGGLDTPDHVDLLVEELQQLEAIEGNMFHTLDAASAERLKQLQLDSSVGYIMPFAGGGLPHTSADFIVVEQATASDEMQSDALGAGLSFFAWTINDEQSMRDMMRRDIDGMITDHPDIALQARAEMDQETGMAEALLDMITRFVKVF